MSHRILPILILISLLPSTVLLAQEPFSINVSPMKTEAEKGEEVTYTINIEADSGFEGEIEFKLVVSVLGISKTYELGVAHPPYPQTLMHSFAVPEEVPGGVTINGKIMAISGDTVVENNVQLKIKGGSILDTIMNTIRQIINQIIQTINNIF